MNNEEVREALLERAMMEVPSYMVKIKKEIREEEDDFIIETIFPYAEKNESRISKEELKRAIVAFYGKDVQEVVRCRDCKYYKESELLPPNKFCFRLRDKAGKPVGYNFSPDDFCSRGERKD